MCKIATPGKKTRGIEEVGGQFRHVCSGAGGEVLENVLEELGNIVAAFAQGRNHDAESSEVVCQLCGKAIGADERPETALREGDDSWGIGSVLAQKAKQGCLDGLRELFGMGDIQHANRGRGVVGTGVCEQGGHCGRGKIDERAVAQWRELMQNAGSGFFAAARLSDDEGGSEVGRYTPDLTSELGDRRA